MIPKWFNKEESIRDKSQRQERGTAKNLRARVSIGSGNLDFDKADVFIKRGTVQFDPKEMRLECKRTDAKSLSIKKDWIDKIIRETKPKEYWAVEVEIQDTKAYLISEEDFRFLQWILTTPIEEILEKLGGSNGSL